MSLHGYTLTSDRCTLSGTTSEVPCIYEMVQSMDMICRNCRKEATQEEIEENDGNCPYCDEPFVEYVPEASVEPHHRAFKFLRLRPTPFH